MNRLLVLVAFVALVAAACGSQRSALEVGDVSVSRGDLIDALEEQGQVTDGVASNAAAAQYLTDQARAVLLQGAADRAGLDVVVDLNNADQVFTTLVAAAVEERVPDIRAVAAASFTCSRHILVSTEAEAADLLTQLDGGADFAARRRSSPSTPARVPPAATWDVCPSARPLPSSRRRSWRAPSTRWSGRWRPTSVST